MRGTPSVTAASLRAFSGRRTNAAERSTTKIVHFLRHGQAEHNPRAEAARDAGASFDEFLQLMKEDDAFDAALTPLGERQAEDAGTLFRTRLAGVQLVVASPLSRAVVTAAIALGVRTRSSMASVPFMLTKAVRRELAETVGLSESEIRAIDPAAAHELIAQQRPPRRFVAIESIRERNGLLLNGKRRARSELAAMHPYCDFSLLTEEEDVLWTEHALESEPSTRARAHESLAWIMAQPESDVLCAAHGGIYSALFARENASDASWSEGAAVEEDALLAQGRVDVLLAPGLTTRFGNCELRSCRVVAERDATGATTVIKMEPLAG
jgi:broad specificity phosphatase PhoE